MALDINGYNATFKAFTDFAQQRMDANDAKAVVDAHINRLDGRKILAVTQSQTDSVHKWTRGFDEWTVNDRTRDLFRKAVIDMFGGESKIPASVKKAMLLSDYNAGKPLTARRIMAVKAAIDADGTVKARSENQRLASFTDPANKAAMIAKGYSKAELPRLARAAHFYAEANNCTEAEALEALTTPGSKANRIMQYGGRFLESAANFREGLRLIDSFATWFAETKAALGALGKGRNFQDGASKTILNGDSSYFDDDVLRGMEKFVFEEFACNAAHNLAEQDPEKLFGMENNAAMRFFGRGLGNSFTQTVANIPPAKRAAFYAAMDAAFPLVSDPAIAKLSVPRRKAQGFQTVSSVDRGTVIGRVMKNLDKLQALLDKGQFTLRAFVKTCFPEARSYSIAGVNALIEKYDKEMNGDLIRGIDPKYPANRIGPMQLLMEETGCTIEEAFTAANGGKRPPIPKYSASGTLSLSAFDGTVREARDQLAGDLDRPANYSIKDGQEDIIPDAGFRIAFPDGAAFKTNASAEGRARIPTVADKVEELCGAVHREQASSVMMMMSQSGLGNLRGGLSGYGVISNEHSPVDFTLSKDAATGAVTITYSSPAELPFRFEWTATVDVFGNVTSTPLKFEKPVENLNAADAKKMVAASAKLLGVKLDREDTATAATLLATHATGMMAKNARVLANFIVNSLHNEGEIDEEMLANLAGDMKGWREFDFGDVKLSEMGRKFVERQNNYLRDTLAKPDMYMDANPDVFTSLYGDASRGSWRIGGKTFPLGANPDAVLNEFLGAVKTPAARKVVSTLLNQGNLADMQCLIGKAPAPVGEARKENDGVETIHTIKGGDMFVSRDYARDMAGITLAADVHYELDVSADGKTATVTVTQDMHLCTKDVQGNPSYRIGKASVSQKTTIDLTKDTPVVTDVTFAQTFTPDEIQRG